MSTPISKAGKQFVVALIPVRGGSMGVVSKNLRVLAGHPLLWYAIESARRATRIHRTIVSTESDEIAEAAQAMGADVVLHPSELSGPDSPTYPVIRWDLHWLRRCQEEPSIVVVLRATSPLRLPEDVDRAVDLLLSRPEADSVVSVGPAVGIHPVRLKRILQDGRLVDAFEPEGSFRADARS